MKTKSDKPKWAKQQHSREAVHWLTFEIATIGDMKARLPSATVACGYALPGDWHKRTTQDSQSVTCWPCCKLARAKGNKIHEEK